MQQQNSPKAIGGLVCGIVSLVLMLIGLFTAGIAGIIGLAVGIVGLVLSIWLGRKCPPPWQQRVLSFLL